MKATRHYPCGFLVFFTLSPSISVQSNDFLIKQDGNQGTIQLEFDSDSNNTNISVRQTGIENFLDAGFGKNVSASIEQYGSYGRINLDTSIGRSNQLQIRQLGEHNRLRSEITGNFNSSATDQTGTDNALVLNVSGNSNQLNIDQGGRSNRTSLSLGGNNGNFDVSQSGSNNIIDVTSFSSNLSMHISQTGNGETITIDN